MNIELGPRDLLRSATLLVLPIAALSACRSESQADSQTSHTSPPVTRNYADSSHTPQVAGNYTDRSIDIALKEKIIQRARENHAGVVFFGVDNQVDDAAGSQLLVRLGRIDRAGQKTVDETAMTLRENTTYVAFQTPSCSGQYILFASLDGGMTYQTLSTFRLHYETCSSFIRADLVPNNY